VIAATGDDKANVVGSLLAKTFFFFIRGAESGGPRQRPRNEWLFDEHGVWTGRCQTPRMLGRSSRRRSPRVIWLVDGVPQGPGQPGEITCQTTRCGAVKEARASTCARRHAGRSARPEGVSDGVRRSRRGWRRVAVRGTAESRTRCGAAHPQSR